MKNHLIFEQQFKCNIFLLFFNFYLVNSDNRAGFSFSSYVAVAKQVSGVGYHESTSATIGSFSNDDGDRNENGKKKKGLINITTTLHVHHTFCTFPCRHCTTTTWKCLLSRFMENVNKRRRIFLSLSKLESGPQEINSKEIRPHFTFSVNWNKRDKVWKNANSF